MLVRPLGMGYMQPNPHHLQTYLKAKQSYYIWKRLGPTQGGRWETPVSNIDIGISMKVEEGLHSMSMKVFSDIKVGSTHCFRFR